MSAAPVALVLVAHSSALAEGLAEVAGQVAPDVLIRPAGGIDGRLGTSYDRVAGITGELLATPGVAGVALLTDLGSSDLTTGAVLEGLDDPRAAHAEGPFVEGAVAAAVAAQGGADLATVRRAVATAPTGGEAPHVPPGAWSARAGAVVPEGAVTSAGEGPGPGPVGSDDASSPDDARTIYLVNRLGLHARPAAILAREAAAHDATVVLNGVPAANVLELMALGLEAGAELRLTASGPGAAGALDAIEALVVDGFGEA